MDKFVSQLEIAIEAGGGIDLRRLCQGMDPTDDGAAVRVIERYAQYRISRRESLDLEELRRAMPWLFDSDAVLRSAVRASIESMIVGGEDPYSAAERLARSHPLAAGEVGRLVASWVDGARRPLPTPDLRTIPCRVGFENHEGLQRFELVREVYRNAHVVRYQATDSMGADPKAFLLIDIIRDAPGDDADKADVDAEAHELQSISCVGVLESGSCSAFERYVAYDTAGCTGLVDWIDARGGRVSPGTAARLVCDVAERIVSMHGLGRCHCEISPRNIVVWPSGRAGLLPGWQSPATESIPGSLDAYTCMGNIPFMAPESAIEGRVYPVSDVYQLGALLAWLVTGYLPNGATSERAFAWFYEEGEHAGFRDSPMPDRIRTLIARSMARKPEARIACAASLAEGLERWLANEPAERNDPGPVQFSLWVKRNPYWAIAAVVMLAVFVMVLGGSRQQLIHKAEVQEAAYRAQIEMLQEEVKSLKIEVARAAGEIEAAELRRVDAVKDRERVLQRAQSIANQWRDSLIRRQQGDPIASLVYLTLMDTLKLPGDELDEELLMDTTERVMAEADKRWDAGNRDIESVLWQILAGQTLQAAKPNGRASEYINRANSILDRILVSRDPIQDRLELRGS